MRVTRVACEGDKGVHVRVTRVTRGAYEGDKGCV